MDKPRGRVHAIGMAAHTSRYAGALGRPRKQRGVLRVVLSFALLVAGGAWLVLPVHARGAASPAATHAAQAAHDEHDEHTGRHAVTGKDWRFMRGAAAAGYGQIQAGKLALTHSTDPAVRGLGKRLVKEYTATNRRLSLLALATQVPLPHAPTRAVRRQLDHLKALRGQAFDQKFLGQFGVPIQRDVVALFNDEATDSDRETGLRHFAGQTLPKLRATLGVAQGLQERDNLAGSRGAHGAVAGAARAPA